MSTTVLAKWRSIENNDEILKKDLKQKDERLNDAFTTSMEFGTAGIRGIMGAGTNKMNIFTVAAAADAYAKYLVANVKDAKKKGVVIGHDNRNNSVLFSETVAKVLLANGIKAYLFENNDLQPTPLISFAIRHMKLAGGAIVTASHNPKEYNGFKVYNNLGAQLMPSETKKIQDIMKDIDPLEVVRESSKEISYIQKDVVDEYVKQVLSVRQREDKGQIKVVFSPLHGTSSVLGPRLLEEMGIEYETVKSQMTNDPEFKKVVSPNPEDGKAYAKAISLARRHKADAIITTDPDADRIGVVVKYQRRYKFLNGNETAALYLEYLLTQLKMQKKLPKNGYIVKTVVSGDLAAKIAKKFGLKVYETHVGFKNIAELIESKKENEQFVFGYEESYGFLIDEDIARDKDALQGIVAVTEMINYHKSQNINTFQHLKDMYKSFGIHRTHVESRVLAKDMTDRLLQRMSKLTKKDKLLDKKVVSVEDYRKGINGLEKTNLVKVNLEGGTWFAIRPSGTEEKVKIYVQTVGDTKQVLMDIVIFEREVLNFVRENTEKFENKHWSWKTFAKYIIFIAIIVAVMAFVFLKVYSQSDGSIWNDAWKILNRQSRWIWLTIFFFVAFNTFLGAWMRKRLIDFQGQKVKTRHLIISALMGQVISFVTPFTIGGDAIGYWYLRRKGFKRGPLLASFITSTLIYQFGIILESAILVPIGIPIYKEIMFNGSTQSHAALILFIVGISWQVFATIMIFSLTVGKRFQEFIVRNTVKLLEWMPFITISDPGALASGYQYEFMEMRGGMKKIWTKKLLILEIMFYELIPIFLNGAAFLFIASGVIRGDLERGSYLSQLVTSDMISTSNSMSLLPGGSGTGEWLSIHINEHVYKTGEQLGLGQGKDATYTASALDFAWKILKTWPMLAVSALMILTVVIGENRRDKYRTINTNRALRGEELSRNSRYYKYIIIPWIVIVILFVVWFVLI